LGLINVAKVSDSNGFALTNAKALDFHREIRIGPERPKSAWRSRRDSGTA
jgi:hypothetical protein